MPHRHPKVAVAANRLFLVKGALPLLRDFFQLLYLNVNNCLCIVENLKILV